MRVSLIVAMGAGRVIGRDNALPWHLPADLQHFRALTRGKPVIMGRKTHESIGRPLPKRRNIVVSRNPSYRAEGCEVVGSLREALALAPPCEEAMVIGGASLYTEALPLADRLYITEVHGSFEGDTFFPAIDPSKWTEIDHVQRPADDANACTMTFRTLDRRP